MVLWVRVRAALPIRRSWVDRTRNPVLKKTKTLFWWVFPMKSGNQKTFWAIIVSTTTSETDIKPDRTRTNSETFHILGQFHFCITTTSTTKWRNKLIQIQTGNNAVPLSPPSSSLPTTFLCVFIKVCFTNWTRVCGFWSFFLTSMRLLVTNSFTLAFCQRLCKQDLSNFA